MSTSDKGETPGVAAVAAGSGHGAPHYMVLRDYTPGGLAERVNSVMVGGFRPVGGIAFSPALNEYLQAVLHDPNTSDDPRP